MTNTSTILSPVAQSATILHFPVGGRGGFRDWRADEIAAAASLHTVSTDAWYHQDAIAEARQSVSLLPKQ